MLQMARVNWNGMGGGQEVGGECSGQHCRLQLGQTRRIGEDRRWIVLVTRKVEGAGTESRRLGALDHGALDLEEATEGRCGGEGGLTM